MAKAKAGALAKLPLHVRILIGFVVGAAAGILVHGLFACDDVKAAGCNLEAHNWLEWIVATFTEPAGRLFLRALLLTVVPLVVSSLIIGVAGLGDLRKLGRVGLKTLAYTLVVSSISVVIGLAIANGVKPGERLDPATRQKLTAKYKEKALETAKKAEESKKPLGEAIVEIIPDNPLAAMAKIPPDMLGIMIFSLFFGAALTLIEEKKQKAVLGVADAIFETVSTMIRLVMYVAPFGVAALLFTMTARFGFWIVASLALYCACVIAGLAIHQFVVYSALLKFVGRVSPLEFFRRIREVMLTAFSTSSSNATLPTALRVTEEKLGVPRDIGSFVLTVGATANQNGTALFEGVTILFLAQVFGKDLTMAQQVMVLVLAVVSGIGTAGVPSGSIPFIAVILGMLGIPVEGIAIILGVDRLLDMCRTTLNVTGDVACAVVIARSEGAKVMGELPAALR